MQINSMTIDELKEYLPTTLDKMYPDYFNYLRKERKRFVFYPDLEQIMFSSCMDEYLNRRGESYSFIIENKELPISLSTILGQMTGLSSEFINDFKEHFMEIASFKDFFKRYGDVVCKSIKRYMDYKDDPRLTEHFSIPLIESSLPNPYDRKKRYFPRKRMFYLHLMYHQ